MHWFPADKVDCDTCRTVEILSDTSFQLVVQGRKDNCVSFDTIAVTIRPHIVVTDTISICEGASYTTQDTTLATPGIFTFSLNDCDSIYQLDLRVIPMQAIEDTMRICQGDSIEIDGIWVAEAGLYPFTIPTSAGCDSMVALTVMINDTYDMEQSLLICPGDSIHIFGEWQKDEGNYTNSYQTAAGCDSLATVILDFYPEYAFYNEISLCEGDSIYIAGQWLKTAGLTTIPLQTAQGCDSMYQIMLSFGQLFMKDEPISLCEGDSVFIDNTWISEEGNYPVTYQNNSGCDSLITYQVTIQDIQRTNDTITLCAGDSIQIYNKWINTAGIYTDTLPDGSCYAIATTLVQEVPKETTSAQFTLCPNDSILLNNTWLTAAGEYPFVFTSSQGCDSIHTAMITLLEAPLPPEVYLDCEALETLAEISADNTWSIQWDNGQEGEYATYTRSGTGSVSLISPPDCEVIYEFDLPTIPSTNTFPTLRDTTVQKEALLEYFLPIYDTQWDIQWSNTSGLLDTTNVFTIVVSNTETITVELQHLSGCSYTLTFTIRVEEEELTIPNVFSPNDDGINDIWQADLTNRENPVTKIFDRWGNLVFHSTSQTPQWDGRYNGKSVNPGVYVYVINFGESSQRKVINGDLTIIR